jgi:DNA gyrase subunit A
MTQSTDDNKTQTQKVSIKKESINTQMSQSYLDYAYSVIIGRAIPDVRDGLKPVQRRILYSMYVNKFTHTNPYKKCARIVGDVLGKYHPHGDTSVYDSLVRMAQDFSMRYPLVEGQGNFGSIDGDPPAAMRYTEARMDVISSEIVADIEKDTVDFVPNFDESLKEPVYMPSKIPNLLINGASGIAVGMSTNMPPYNLREVISGITAVIDNPHMYPEEISQYIKGPDFPTKGIIMGRKGIRNIINNGRGKIIVRGRVEIEDRRILITEIPYQVNKLKLVENIAHLINNKKIRSVSDLRDESNREGIRIVLELRKDADPNAIKNQLYMMTRLQSSFSIHNRVLVDNNGLQPTVLNLMGLIKAHIDNRENIIIRRTKYEHTHAKERLHIVDGLLIAIANIDDVVQIIKNATDTSDARDNLMKKYSLSEIQTDAILDMPLRRLTGLQTQKLQDEKTTIIENIKKYEEILADKKIRMQIIKDELAEIDKKYGDDRLTEILDVPEDSTEPEEEMLKVIPEETCVIMLTENQYIKRMTLKTYQAQNRGGKGKKGINKRDEDIIRDVFVVSSHDKVLLFTAQGRVYSKYAHEIPLMSRTSRGKALVNFVGLKPDEQIVHMVPVADFEQDDFLVFVTKRGIVKRTSINEFRNIRKTGILAINLRENDELVNVKLSEEDYYILIATEHGYAIKFSDLEVRPLSRKAMGVQGIRLREDDNVVDMVIGDNDTDVITITKKGYGKRSKVELYRETRRGGKGVINIKFRDEDDSVNSVKAATDEDLLIATTNGLIIRVPSLSLRYLSRSAKGVKVIELNEEDFVSSVALCERSDDDEEEESEEKDSEEDESVDSEEEDESAQTENSTDGT